MSDDVGLFVYFLNILIFVISVLALANATGIIIGLLGAITVNSLASVLLLEKHLMMCKKKKEGLFEKKD